GEAADIAQPDDVLAVGRSGEAQTRVLAVAGSAVVITIRQVDQRQTITGELRARRMNLDLIHRRVVGVRFARGVEHGHALASERDKACVIVRTSRHGVELDDLAANQSVISNSEAGGTQNAYAGLNGVVVAQRSCGLEHAADGGALDRMAFSVQDLEQRIERRA